MVQIVNNITPPQYQVDGLVIALDYTINMCRRAMQEDNHEEARQFFALYLKLDKELETLIAEQE